MHPTLNSDWMEAVLGEELPREAKIAPLPQPHQPILPPRPPSPAPAVEAWHFNPQTAREVPQPHFINGGTEAKKGGIIYSRQ